MRQKIIYSLIVVIFVLSVYSIVVRWEYIIGGYDSKIEETEQQVRAYLFDQKGYNEGEIDAIDGQYNRKHENYVVDVTFKDEPDFIYYYTTYGEDVVQLGYGFNESANETVDKARHLE